MILCYGYPTVQKWSHKYYSQKLENIIVQWALCFIKKESIWQMISFLNHENCQVQKSLVKLIVEEASFFRATLFLYNW